MQQRKSVLPLFLQFLKFGCFTFGGGWSIVSQMQKIYVEEKRVIGNEELLDLTSVGRSLPGTMVGNIAVLFGYRQAGIPGSLACIFGLILPPMLVLAVITIFYTAFRENAWVAAGMNGIRVAVVPIILSAVFPMMKTAFQNSFGICVALLSFAAYLLFDVNCVWLVLGGAAAGLAVKFLTSKQGRAEK